MLLDQLNEPQREAVQNTQGPLLVLAGAGSGKTKMLTSRIAYLIDHQNVAPYHILAVTFTNKAAKEMKHRVSQLVITPSHSNRFLYPEIGTFHALCLKILRKERAHTPYQQSFNIYDDNDQLNLIKDVLLSFDIDPKVMNPKTLQTSINRLKCDCATFEQVEEKNFYLKTLKKVYKKYQDLLLQNCAIDFGDIICQTYYLLKNNPTIRTYYQNLYQYIHVDEYQDTNLSQMLLLNILAQKAHGGHENICVVGDEDQSIYSWRGAKVENILHFQTDYPTAKLIKLEQNYRCTNLILASANAVIQNNTLRYDKKLWSTKESTAKIILAHLDDERQESQFVIKKIQQQLEKAIPYKDIAIFYRTNAQSRPFEDVLRRYKIPYQIYGGLRFYDRKEIKDILAYLKVLLNPLDSLNLKRILNIPARGIGKTSLEKIDAFCLENYLTFWETLQFVINEPQKFGASVSKKIGSFLSLMQDLKQQSTELKPSELFHAILEKTQYMAYLKKFDALEFDNRVENLQELDLVLQEFESEHPELEPLKLLEQFIEESTLAVATENEKTPGIQLMTLHASKGLEFDTVFIVGLEDGIFPSQRLTETSPHEIEEERRLLYVGMTRAKEQLFLSHVRIRTLWGQLKVQLPSRFLKEIPKKYLQTATK